MKILVTGAAGLIGNNLVEYFLSKKGKVVSLDNFSTGHLHNTAPL
jgi:UDP-N-acetylglucosamine 4-epimerase